MANPTAHLTKKSVILAKMENTETTASGTPTTTVIETGATFVADAEIGNFATFGDAATLDASANVETRIISDNTTSSLTLNEALSFTPSSGDYVSVNRYGTDPTPTVAANAVLTTAPSITVNGEVLEREAVRKTLSPLDPQIGNRSIEISFSVEMKGNSKTSTVANVPEVDPLLRACGFVRTLATNDRVYLPQSDSSESCTIYAYLDQMVYKITGCIGNVSFKTEQGKYGMMDFTFKGLYADLADEAPTGTFAYDTTLPPVLNSAAFNFTYSGGTADTTFSVSKFELDMSNEVAELRNMSNTSVGPERFYIASRKPTGSFDPQQVLTGDHNLHNAWAQSTAITTMKMTLGTTSGNKIEFDLGNDTRFNSIAPADDGGMRRFEMGFNMGNDVNSSDTELKISYKGD